jgi:hypothetical protein
MPSDHKTFVDVFGYSCHTFHEMSGTWVAPQTPLSGSRELQLEETRKRYGHRTLPISKSKTQTPGTCI